MPSRLQKLNGWQRLWLVGTVGLGLWFVGIWPMQQAGEGVYSPFHYGWRRVLENDFKNPQCRIYQTARFETLPEPPFNLEGGSCWHMYKDRTYSSAEVPFTLEAYDRRKGQEWRELYLGLLGLGFAGTLLISVGVYFVGWVIGWIVKGFRTA